MPVACWPLESLALPAVHNFRGLLLSFFFPRKRAKTASYSYQLSQLLSFLECGGGFNAETAGRLSALWRDGEFCPHMHSYFSVTFMNLNQLLCCFSPRRTRSFVAVHHFPLRRSLFFVTSTSPTTAPLCFFFYLFTFFHTVCNIFFTNYLAMI